MTFGLVRESTDSPLRESMFDESYNIREVLDDILERVTLREKLIQTARQFNEKKRDERYLLALKQFENLMQDFLRLYQPILDRLRGHRDVLQKDLEGLRIGLSTISGMLDVSRGIEGLAPKIERLQADGQELEATISEKAKTLGKIEELLNRIQPYLSGGSSPTTIVQDPLSDALSGMPKDLFSDIGSEKTREIFSTPTKRTGKNNQ